MFGTRLHARALLGRTLLALALVLALMLALAPTAAYALDFRSGDQVTVPAGTTVDDDLFAAAETVTIAGDVRGEVYAFGRSVMVTGTIERDLIAAAQQVTVDGAIKGDLRGAAQQVTVNGQVDGSLTGAGQFVTLGRQARVEGNLVGAAQDVSLLGTVGRGVVAGAGSLEVGSDVGGDVRTAVGTLTVDPAARIGGRLDYTSERVGTIPAETVAGGVQYRPVEHEGAVRTEEPQPQANPFGGLFSLFGLAWLTGSIILGVLLVHFFPTFAAGTTAQVQEHGLASFGVGVTALFVVPISALVVACTVIGLPIAFVTALAYLAALYVGSLVLGVALGALLAQLVRRAGWPARLRPEVLAALGLVALYVVTQLPWIGGLATFVALSLGLGAVLRQIAALRSGRPTAPLPTA